MSTYSRSLDLKSLVKNSSAFLFGARGTGKTFLMRETLGETALIINLLKTQEFLRLSENPALLGAMVEASNKSLVVIDEIQKLPILLDEVHDLISEKRARFLLTGSSARKLKRSQANLLAGRARLAYLHPLTRHEIPEFQLENFLLWGGLPEVWQVEDQNDFLDSYIETYLKEEILAEQVARSLPHFSRFLKVAALVSGELLNFAGTASDAALPVSTVKNYFEALGDTLVGYLLPPWSGRGRRKAIQTSKFYFFDVGVRNRLLNITELPARSDVFGRSFEHFIFMELKAYLSYTKDRRELFFWRSVNHHEVDFVFDKNLAIEVKAKNKTSLRDARGLLVLKEEKAHDTLVVVSQDPIERKEEGVHFMHWQNFLQKLWSGGFK